jgi:mediator of RNA polymerase II transcription subunit 5
VLTKLSDVRKTFIQSISTFIPFLSQTSLQIANRLELSQKEHDFHDKSLATANGENTENTGLEVAALQLENVLDLPPLNTRAGLYIFFNSLVSLRNSGGHDVSDLASLLRALLLMTILSSITYIHATR